MWFGVLGPLLVSDANSVIDIPPGRQRVLLAALLMQAGTVVSTDALAEVMWDGVPPSGAETTLRSYVMRLRRLLGPGPGTRVATRYPGYLIEAADEEVDLLRFRRLYRDGGDAVRAADWESAWAVLTEGLGLWRGELLADVRSEALRRDHGPGLEELRLQAVEWQLEAGLHLGRHGELVPELRSLVTRYPLRERFSGQLMLALARCDRTAEALAAYQSVREVLAEELGAEPGTWLRELHERILSGDPALAAPPPAALAPAVLAGHQATVVPRELPTPVAGFVGRSEELAALTRLLDHSSQQRPPAIVISAIGGTAGVGKTALAVRWAHQTAGRFPDGQLYVNLRGYDPHQPMTAADALARLLRALGVPGLEIPPEQEERAARYRSLLSGRKILIVLDNARSVEQVRPLLPGSPRCAVVVTSRDSLGGLVARHGAIRLELDLLPPAEAVGLLRTLIGGRVDDDLGAAETLAGQCCRLPLALRVAAEFAVVRPAVSLAELVGELADQQRRLDLLDAGGDPRTAVRAVFSWSYRHLDPGTARAFRLLGLHPGPDFDPYAAAALTGTGLEQADRDLHVLTRAHLIQATGPDRYGLHDLLRAYARELAADDGEDEVHAVLTRLFDHYLHAAAVAMDSLYPADRYRRPRIPAPSSPAPPVVDSAGARAWLDAERTTLVVVTAHAAGHGWPAHATQLAATLFRYLDHGGYYAEAISVAGHARDAAEQAGDPAAEAMALNQLAIVHWRQSRYPEATSYLNQALTLFRQVDDRAMQARVLNNLGLICYAQGRYADAIGLHRQTLPLYREAGDLVGEATGLNNLSISEERLGRYDVAAGDCQRALDIAEEIGASSTESIARVNLGTVSLRQGCYEQAADQLRRGLARCRELGFRDGVAEALTRIGDVRLRQGHAWEAADHVEQAVAVYREIGNQAGEADALNSLGEVLLVTGRPGDARTQHAVALRLAVQIGDKYQQARAHDGLGHAVPGEAAFHWRQALALFTDLGTPEAGQVRDRLEGS